MKLPGVLVHRKSKGETLPGAQAARLAHTSLAVAAADELVDLFSDAVNKSFKADISDALTTSGWQSCFWTSTSRRS